MTEMSPAETVFFAALAKIDLAERAAYLNEACGPDADLRRRVDRLLAAHPQVGSFLQDAAAVHPSPLGGVGPEVRGRATVDVPITEGPSTVIGPYKLLQQIGEGGMGTVFMAEQTEPIQRKVALKVIKPGMDSKQVIARFEAERQALAMMDHVNIARVLDAGATEAGRPYFVMELVHGVPITKYCDDNHLTPRERLELFVPVCQAIQHAHQKGIIHRDIKPSNVMITLYDGKPVPKVIDFGVAKATEQKLTERTLFTQYGTMVGTLEYMSPEQAEMSALGVDTRSDIYSLGVLLYELLTGSTPLTHKRMKEVAYAEILRMIKEEEPQKPSTRLSDSGQALASISAQRHMEPAKLTKLMRGELDWIVMKTLEKDRNRRYETAKDFATDVQRYLNDETVQACPPSAGYRFRKFARRNRRILATACVLGIALCLGTAISTWQAIRATQAEGLAEDRLKAEQSERERAVRAEGEKTEQLWQALWAQGQARRYSRQMGQRLDSLAALEKAARIRPDARLRDEAIAAMALPDIRRGASFHGYPAGTKAVAFDGRYQTYAWIDEQGNISIHRLPDNEKIGSIKPKMKGKANFIWLSSDGQFLAVRDDLGAVQLWRIADGNPLLGEALGQCTSFTFSPDSRQVAVAKDDWVLCIDLASGQETTRWRLPARAHALAFHPNNRRLAVGYANNKIASIYDSAQGSRVADLLVGLMNNQSVAWHPDGARLAVAGSDPRIQIWDVATQRKLATLEGHVQHVWALSFHPDGSLLASQSEEGVLRLWDPATGRQLMQLPLVAVPRFSSTGQYLGHLWQGGEQLQLLEVTASREYRTIVSSSGAGRGDYHDGDISPDGRLLALGMGDGDRLWDLSSGRELAVLPSGSQCVLFQPNGRELLTCGATGLHCWPIQEGKEAANELRLGPPRKFALPFMPHRAARSPDGRTLAIVSETSDAGLLMDLKAESVQGQHFAHPRASEVALSRDGRWVASCGWHSDRVRLWNAKTGDKVHEWVLGVYTRVCFTPDSRALIICRGDAFTFWDVETLQPIRRLERDVALFPGYVAFSLDGKLMALEMGPAVIHLKEVATGRTVAKLEDPNGDRAGWIGFTPDGTQLVVAAPYAKAVHVWDLRAIRQRLKGMDLDWHWPEFPPAGPDAGQPLQIQVDPGELGAIPKDRAYQLEAHGHLQSRQWSALETATVPSESTQRLSQTYLAHGIVSERSCDRRRAAVTFNPPVAKDVCPCG